MPCVQKAHAAGVASCAVASVVMTPSLLASVEGYKWRTPKCEQNSDRVELAKRRQVTPSRFWVTTGVPEQPSALRDMASHPPRALCSLNAQSSLPTLAHSGRRIAGVQLSAHGARYALLNALSGANGPDCATTAKPEKRSLASHISR